MFQGLWADVCWNECKPLNRLGSGMNPKGLVAYVSTATFCGWRLPEVPCFGILVESWCILATLCRLTAAAYFVFTMHNKTLQC